MSKVFLFNGSPRMDKGNTSMLLAPFIRGMEEAGATVDLIYASRLDIKPCSCGRMYRWYGQPGECVIGDEMAALYARIGAAETLVFATPVYSPLPGKMQDVINRLCPLAFPLLETRDGRTRPRFRAGVQIRRIALVATSGWWEVANTDVVVRIVQEFAENGGVPFAGALLRPHACAIQADGALTAGGEAVLEAAHRAGRELVKVGRMTQETPAAVSRPLVDRETLLQQHNHALH